MKAMGKTPVFVGEAVVTKRKNSTGRGKCNPHKMGLKTKTLRRNP